MLGRGLAPSGARRSGTQPLQVTGHLAGYAAQLIHDLRVITGIQLRALPLRSQSRRGFQQHRDPGKPVTEPFSVVGLHDPTDACFGREVQSFYSVWRQVLPLLHSAPTGVILQKYRRSPRSSVR